METRFDPFLVVLSILVATFASYVALNLANSVEQSQGRTRAVWLAGGALAMGVGIWSMHFIGMLAFEMPGMTMAYDIPLMVLSIVVAIGASALALYIVSRPSVPAISIATGGIAMAAAIAGMHYIGMYSMRMDAKIQWNLYLVALSIAIALFASLAALNILTRLRNKMERFFQLGLASVVMGIAIAGMHYTGMIAATFVHTPKHPAYMGHMGHMDRSSNIMVSSGLSLAVVAMTVLILGLALAGSIGQRIFIQWRLQSMDVLENSEKRFRLLVETVKDYAIFMLNPEGLITTWNAGAERITGYSAMDAIGKHFSTFSPPAAGEHISPAEELQIAQSKGHFEGESLRLRKDGSTYWANVVITPLYDENRKLTGFSKVTRDITQLKEATRRMTEVNQDLENRVKTRTEELLRREIQLSNITNALPVLLGQLDKEERFLFANNAFCKWFGAEGNSIIGRTFKSILGDRYAANEPYIKKVLAGETTVYERVSVSASGDSAKPAVLSITYVPEFRAGVVVGFILIASDITKHKATEAELKKAKEAAEVANMTKSAFLANMSHEIRTPLGAVLGFSELMLNHDISEAERLSNMEIIKRNGRMLSTIINDILDLSKVESGKLEVEKIKTPFAEIMTEIGRILNLEASGKGISLRVTAEGMIPQTVNTDPLRLRQILINIIGNAIKFTEEGSVDVSVKMIANGAHSPKLAFVVKDTGHGIGAEQAERLFKPFTQADVSTTRRFGGTGLGLVLSKKLANLLGGDVILKESISGKGSTFIVTIDPGAEQELTLHNGEFSESRLPFSTEDRLVNLQNLRVLVVDDSPENRVLIEVFLTRAGANVEVAENGRQAVEKALSGDFNLVLMDLQMPVMDGYAATKELRAQGYTRPIIALTAHAMKEERQRCLENGFNDHLTKPVDRHSLLQTLAEYQA